MKSIYSLLLVLLVLGACGKSGSVEKVIESNDVEKIRAKKKELSQEQEALAEKVGLLDQKLEELDTTKRYPLVTKIDVSTQLFEHYLELQGNVHTRQNVLIYPEVQGVLERVLVKDGQKVVKNQLLAVVNDGGMKQQIAQLKATEALLKTTYERQSRLWDQKIGSEIQYLESKANYVAQKNAVAQAQKQLQKYKIVAPFTGVIDEVIKDEGTIVAPGAGAEMFRIVNLSKMFVDTDVPENYIGSVTNDKKAIVEFPVLGKTIESKVLQAGSFINPSNRTFKVEVPVPSENGMVKPNLTAKVKINDYTSEEAVLIPMSVVSENVQGEQYVYVLDNITEKNKRTLGEVTQRVVETGKTQDDLIEVLSGLSSGDQVVIEGARTVKEGQQVEVLNEDTKK